MSGSPDYLVSQVSPGNYVISNLPDGTYYPAAFMDVNGNKGRNTDEPSGMYGEPDPVMVLGGAETSEIDIIFATSGGVVITSPASGDVVGGIVDITAEASAGTTRVDFYFDSTFIASDTTNSYSVSWDTTKVSDGTYNLKAVAFDQVGNTITSATVSVTVNNPAPTPSLEGLIVYPNPFKSSKHSEVIFKGLTQDAKVLIFTLSGELVIKVEPGTTSWSWDVKNDKGENVARGVYVYLVSNPAGEKRIGKIAIIRETAE